MVNRFPIIAFQKPLTSMLKSWMGQSIHGTNPCFHEIGQRMIGFFWGGLRQRTFISFGWAGIRVSHLWFQLSLSWFGEEIIVWIKDHNPTMVLVEQLLEDLKNEPSIFSLIETFNIVKGKMIDLIHLCWVIIVSDMYHGHSPLKIYLIVFVRVKKKSWQVIQHAWECPQMHAITS